MIMTVQIMIQIDNSGLDGTFGLLLTFGGSLLQQLSRSMNLSIMIVMIRTMTMMTMMTMMTTMMVGADDDNDDVQLHRGRKRFLANGN